MFENDNFEEAFQFAKKSLEIYPNHFESKELVEKINKEYNN